MTQTLEGFYLKLSQDLPLPIDEEEVEKRVGSAIEKTLAEYFVQLGKAITQEEGELQLSDGPLRWETTTDAYDDDYGEINFSYGDVTFRLYFWTPYEAKERNYTQVMLTEKHFSFIFSLEVERLELSPSFMDALEQVQEIQQVRGGTRHEMSANSTKELLNLVTDHAGVYDEHYELYLSTGETIIVHGRLGASVEDAPLDMVMSYRDELYALTGNYNSYGSHHWNFDSIFRCKLNYRGAATSEFERLGEEWLDLD